VNFVVSGHTLINIILTAAMVILAGVTYLIFLLEQNRSSVQRKISLKELSHLWAKNTAGEIHISELASIWREEKDSGKHDHNNSGDTIPIKLQTDISNTSSSWPPIYFSYLRISSSRLKHLGFVKYVVPITYSFK